MKKSKIICVMNQKGGVGKTTTAVNLATAFAAVEHKVLLIDLDPQGNATTGVGIFHLKHTVYEALMHLRPLQDVIIKTFLPCLKLVGSNNELAGAEIELVPLLDREKHLLSAIEALKTKYQYIFIDCPPSLGLLTLNALVACDFVLIPLQCEFYALDGLSRLLANVQTIRQTFNPDLKILGILLTMYDGRCLLNQQVAQNVREYFKHLILPVEIPRNIKIAEASSHGKPIIFYDRKSLGALRYLELTHYLLTIYSW
ncbi:ParA family protein [Holospora curviuscula]|uniref:Chromosome partitioning protein ParA n=1 Tax=Holospora curviuscula TaxID=1082868 RepID=A0A2S5R865_9PROT|nr:AAA family ATPase [Holospora curviuscula]PPE03508.1 Sporulation initiation inhibitor protein Soj [Holospora curviuscula]